MALSTTKYGCWFLDKGNPYSHGAAFLRMLEGVLGKDLFRLSVRRYLKRFAFANADSKDFIQIIADTVEDGRWLYHNEVDVKAFMRDWIFQPNVPRLKLRRKGRKLDVTQSCVSAPHSKCSLIWKTPIFYHLHGRFRMLWLTEPSQTFEFSSVHELKSVQWDPEQIGMYSLVIE